MLLAKYQPNKKAVKIADKNYNQIKSTIELKPTSYNFSELVSAILITPIASTISAFSVSIISENTSDWKVVYNNNVSGDTEFYDTLTLSDLTLRTATTHQSINFAVAYTPTREASTDDVNEARMYVTYTVDGTDYVVDLSINACVVDFNDHIKQQLDTFGLDVSSDTYEAFKDTPIRLNYKDADVMNTKRRELLLRQFDIKGFVGSYKSLLNVIDFMGYGELLEVREVWSKVGELGTEVVATAVTNDVLDYVDKRLTGFKKTNNLQLVYDINAKDGTFDNGLANYVNVLLDTDVVLYKMYLIRDILERDYLAYNVKISDVIGEYTQESRNVVSVWENASQTVCVEGSGAKDRMKLECEQDELLISNRYVLTRDSVFEVGDDSVVQNNTAYVMGIVNEPFNNRTRVVRYNITNGFSEIIAFDCEDAQNLAFDTTNQVIYCVKETSSGVYVLSLDSIKHFTKTAVSMDEPNNLTFHDGKLYFIESGDLKYVSLVDYSINTVGATGISDAQDLIIEGTTVYVVGVCTLYTFDLSDVATVHSEGVLLGTETVNMTGVSIVYDGDGLPYKLVVSSALSTYTSSLVTIDISTINTNDLVVESTVYNNLPVSILDLSAMRNFSFDLPQLITCVGDYSFNSIAEASTQTFTEGETACIGNTLYKAVTLPPLSGVIKGFKVTAEGIYSVTTSGNQSYISLNQNIITTINQSTSTTYNVVHELLIHNGYAYVETVLGGANNLGGVERVDLQTGEIENILSFSNTIGYGEVFLNNSLSDKDKVIIGDELFLINSKGGANDKGTVLKINLQTKSVTVLADLNTASGNNEPYTKGQAYSHNGNYIALYGNVFATYDTTTQTYTEHLYSTASGIYRIYDSVLVDDVLYFTRDPYKFGVLDLDSLNYQEFTSSDYAYTVFYDNVNNKVFQKGHYSITRDTFSYDIATGVHGIDTTHKPYISYGTVNFFSYGGELYYSSNDNNILGIGVNSHVEIYKYNLETQTKTRVLLTDNSVQYTANNTTTFDIGQSPIFLQISPDQQTYNHEKANTYPSTDFLWLEDVIEDIDTQPSSDYELMAHFHSLDCAILTTTIDFDYSEYNRFKIQVFSTNALNTTENPSHLFDSGIQDISELEPTTKLATLVTGAYTLRYTLFDMQGGVKVVEKEYTVATQAPDFSLCLIDRRNTNPYTGLVSNYAYTSTTNLDTFVGDYEFNTIAEASVQAYNEGDTVLIGEGSIYEAVEESNPTGNHIDISQAPIYLQLVGSLTTTPIYRHRAHQLDVNKYQTHHATSLIHQRDTLSPTDIEVTNTQASGLGAHPSTIATDPLTPFTELSNVSEGLTGNKGANPFEAYTDLFGTFRATDGYPWHTATDLTFDVNNYELDQTDYSVTYEIRDLMNRTPDAYMRETHLGNFMSTKTRLLTNARSTDFGYTHARWYIDILGDELDGSKTFTVNLKTLSFTYTRSYVSANETPIQFIKACVTELNESSDLLAQGFTFALEGVSDDDVTTKYMVRAMFRYKGYESDMFTITGSDVKVTDYKAYGSLQGFARCSVDTSTTTGTFTLTRVNEEMLGLSLTQTETTVYSNTMTYVDIADLVNQINALTTINNVDIYALATDTNEIHLFSRDNIKVYYDALGTQSLKCIGMDGAILGVNHVGSFIEQGQPFFAYVNTYSRTDDYFIHWRLINATNNEVVVEQYSLVFRYMLFQQGTFNLEVSITDRNGTHNLTKNGFVTVV